MSSRLLLIYTGLLVYISTLQAEAYDEPSFQEAIKILYDVCDAHFTCRGIIVAKPTLCCGSCECDWKCFEYGSCFLAFMIITRMCVDPLRMIGKLIVNQIHTNSLRTRDDNN